MELVRPDFSLLFDQMRRSLGELAPELTTAKARSTLASLDRTIAMIRAEFGLLRDEEVAIEARADALLAAIGASATPPIEPDSGVIARLFAKHCAIQSSIGYLAERATGGDGGAKALLQAIQDDEEAELVELRRRCVEAEPLADPGEIGAGGAARPAIARDALQAYLRSVLPGEAGLIVSSIVEVPGGRSKETMLVTVDGAVAHPARLVIRSDIPGGLVPSRAIDEFPLLQVAERHGVPVPSPFHCEPDPTALGRSFIVVAAVAGRSVADYFPEIGEGIPPEQRHSVGVQLAGILARLHGIRLSEFEGTHLDLKADLRALVERAIDGTIAEARDDVSPSRVLPEIAYDWLKRNIHLADDVPCLIHCDVGLHNMLIDGGRITAMLDWELACVASPAREVAKILHLIDYLMPREQFFEEYIAAGGPKNAIDPARLTFYAVMNYYVTNQRCRHGSHLFYTGTLKSIVMANVAYDSYVRNSLLLARALAEGQSLTDLAEPMWETLPADA